MKYLKNTKQDETEDTERPQFLNTGMRRSRQAAQQKVNGRSQPASSKIQ